MHVLHACWLADPSATGQPQIGVWGEDSSLPAAPPTRPGRRPTVQDHPYALAATHLGAALNLDTPGTTTLTLPSRSGAPLPSPELLRDDVASERGAVRAGAWRVPTVTLATDALLRTLGQLTSADREDAVGASLRHLMDVERFATDLVRRGRLLPSVDPTPSTTAAPQGISTQARWRPVLTGADAAWARLLAGTVPPALFAAHPEATPQTWAQILYALVDAAARLALRGKLSLGRRGSRTARAWLAGLQGDDSTIPATPEQLQDLAGELTGWQADAFAGPVRACFRLTDPAAEEDTWRLRLGLQDAEDPGTVVDATAVWKSRGELPGLGRQLARPQETFLTELGKAVRLYPGLDDALRTARPVKLDLDTTGAHDFLREAAPMLAAAGFGVQLPGWWSKPSARLGIRIKASSPSQPGVVAGQAGQAGLDAIVQFRYDLALGEETVTPEELEALADAKSGLVRLRGQWLELDPRRLAAGLKMAGQSGEMSVRDVVRLGLAPASEEELPVTGVSADGWLGELLSSQAELRVQPVELPDSFTGQLRPYQSRGLSWLDFLGRAGLGGVLADDMGLGKTVQLLALLAAAPSDRPSLLICPMSLVGNWQREAAKFTPELRVHVHHGAERARGKAFTTAIAASDLVITTYALAARDATALRGIEWNRVVVDEAQAIKNAATRQATAIRSIPAGTRIAVTGTPVENRLADLWSILEFANPGLLGTAARFKKAYAEPIERRGDEEAAERLRQFTGPFILRRVKTDRSIISDLPEKLEMDVVCNLTGEQAALYQAVVDDMLEKIENSEGIERRGLVLATMTKLKQVCNHPAQFLGDGSRLAGRSGKLQRLEQVLEEVLAAGEKALLFTQYAQFGGMLRSHLSATFGREVLFLHGGVTKAAREEMVTRFQAEDSWAPTLFVLSLKAGGTGLTLTAANHVVHVDRWWNPAVEDQATDRAFRIGQRRNVQVRKFVCAGTMEERVAEMITAKRGLAAKIVGTSEQWLTELSTAQLAELIALDAAAVVE